MRNLTIFALTLAAVSTLSLATPAFSQASLPKLTLQHVEMPKPPAAPAMPSLKDVSGAFTHPEMAGKPTSPTARRNKIDYFVLNRRVLMAAK